MKEEQAETEDSESPVEEEMEENSEELTENELQMLESGIVSRQLLCSKLTIETLEQSVKYVQGCQWLGSDVFIVNFEHVSHLVLVFLLLTLSR